MTRDYDGHQIEFDEAELMMSGVYYAVSGEGYVQLDRAGLIESITFKNIDSSDQKLVKVYRLDRAFADLSESLELHLKKELDVISHDLDGYENFDANREYGTYDTRAL